MITCINIDHPQNYSYGSVSTGRNNYYNCWNSMQKGVLPLCYDMDAVFTPTIHKVTRHEISRLSE